MDATLTPEKTDSKICLEIRLRSVQLFYVLHLSLNVKCHSCVQMSLVVASVTRLGDLLHFGQIFKTCGNNYFAESAQIFGIFKGVKIFHFSSEFIFGQLLATFYWSRWW